jgi:hypothetical protein
LKMKNMSKIVSVRMNGSDEKTLSEVCGILQCSPSKAIKQALRHLVNENPHIITETQPQTRQEGEPLKITIPPDAVLKAYTKSTIKEIEAEKLRQTEIDRELKAQGAKNKALAKAMTEYLTGRKTQ